MTYLEKARELYPDRLHGLNDTDLSEGWCPEDFFDGDNQLGHCKASAPIDCWNCWNREMPNKNNESEEIKL